MTGFVVVGTVKQEGVVWWWEPLRGGAGVKKKGIVDPRIPTFSMPDEIISNHIK